MKQKIMALMMLLFVAALVFTGCEKTAPPKDEQKDAATTGVTQGISDVDNLTTLDDSSLDINLGSADKSLMDW